MLPDKGRKTLILGLSNISNIVKISGIATKDSGNDTVNLLQLTSLLLYRKSTDTLFIDTTENRSDYDACLDIYYTKNT